MSILENGDKKYSALISEWDIVTSAKFIDSMDILTITISILLIIFALFAWTKFIIGLDSCKWTNPKNYWKHNPY